MKKKEKKETLKIDLFSFEREKISAQAMGNLLGGGMGCQCRELLDKYGLENATLLTMM
jgi:hypothetical protein